MTIARVFTSGDDQYVLLPKEFAFTAGEVDITRGEGRELILKPRYKGLEEAVDALRDLPDDVIEAIVEMKRIERERA